MTCSYCGSRNSESEHRCRRCGRRPGDTLTGEVTWRRTNGALAAQFQPQARAAVTESPLPASPPRRVPNLQNPMQRSLFQDRVISNVIPFEAFAPPRSQAAKKQPPAGSKPSARRAPRVPEGQGRLDFLPPSAPQPRKLGTTVDAVIFCEFPVAATLHRAAAAAIDWSFVLIAYGLFLAVFYWSCGGFPETRASLTILGAVLPILGFTYGLIFTIACAETPGMHWTRLRLTTFDGFQPEPKQRVLRFLGSCLSLCTVVGMLWSLADEESLGWQDHISSTFPTPRALDRQVFLRR
jgi:uncharacterized RDD family membrane protein YckC